jgi:hypothetical protein
MTASAKEVEVIGAEPDVTFRVGRLTWRVDGADVIVTRDDGGGIVTLNLFSYKNNDAACEAGWRMANRQLRA